jgi:hypothetical protein
MMELVCAGVIVARNDLWARAALDDLSSTPYLTADLDHAQTEGFCAFRLVGTRRSFGLPV